MLNLIWLRPKIGVLPSIVAMFRWKKMPMKRMLDELKLHSYACKDLSTCTERATEFHRSFHVFSCFSLVEWLFYIALSGPLKNKFISPQFGISKLSPCEIWIIDGDTQSHIGVPQKLNDSRKTLENHWKTIGKRWMILGIPSLTELEKHWKTIRNHPHNFPAWRISGALRLSRTSRTSCLPVDMRLGVAYIGGRDDDTGLLMAFLKGVAKNMPNINMLGINT